MRLPLAALVFFAAVCLTLQADDAVPEQPVSVATLLQQATDFSTLPLHRNWRTNLTSSRDPTGGNGDCQQFVSLQGDHAVLADLKGPGAIVRFWSTAVYKNAAGNLTADPSGWLKIFIDDNPKPVIDEPFADFYDKHEPFTQPLTDHYGAATISYLPIPYAKHCLVTLDKPQDQFYQIQSIAFPEGTQVRPFALPLTDEDEKALKVASDKWNEAAKPAKVGDLFAAPFLDLAPGQTWATNLVGPERIESLRFAALHADNTALRNLIIRAWFDGHKTPDIEAPVADFFGNAYGSKPFNSFFLERHGPDACMFCRFPMPFKTTAKFSFENRSSQTVSINFIADQVATTKANSGSTGLGSPDIVDDPFPPGTEYFHADFNQEITKSGRAHAWLKIAGQAGHFVGVTQTMQGGETLGYCEGDDQLRVDEQKWGAPTKDFPDTVVGPWNGTGTEDCFNSAWYFGDGIVSRPMNGCLVREDLGRIDTFRFFVNDAPVWQDSIDAQIEHGATNEGDGLYYSSVAYWYGPGERQSMQPFPSGSLDFPKVKFLDRNLAATQIEGESALESAKATAGKVEKQEMPGYLDVWSDGAQLAWSGSKKGDTLDFVINIPKAGDYSLTAFVGHGPDYGAYNVAIAGKPLGFNDDAYDPEDHNVRQDWGQATLPAGPCHITIKQLDTDGRSKETRFGLDVIDLFLNKAAQ
jgi:hypothetical protein